MLVCAQVVCCLRWVNRTSQLVGGRLFFIIVPPARLLYLFAVLARSLVSWDLGIRQSFVVLNLVNSKYVAISLKKILFFSVDEKNQYSFTITYPGQIWLGIIPRQSSLILLKNQWLWYDYTASAVKISFMEMSVWISFCNQYLHKKQTSLHLQSLSVLYDISLQIYYNRL